MNCQNCDGPLSEDDGICEKCGTLVERNDVKKDISSGMKMMILLLTSIVIVFGVLQINNKISNKTGRETVENYYTAIDNLDVNMYVNTMNTIKLSELGIQKNSNIPKELEEEFLEELTYLKEGHISEFGENWIKLMTLKNIDREDEYSIFQVSFSDTDIFNIELIKEKNEWNIVIIY